MSENQQLFIPDKLKVGFDKRDDTYTGKLAYVIYWRGTKLCKEKSWEGWRDKKIKPVEHDNAPTEGFVLNKKVGGYKSEWNFRDAHVRVYDPRDFEFEISVPNLVFILSCCDCSRGKGLEGKFVYAWDKSELVLLPVDSDEYRKSKSFTVLQSQRVIGKELVAGGTYLTKQQKELVYVGRFEHYFAVHAGDGGRSWDKPSPAGDQKGVCKKYVFWDPAWKYDKYSDDLSAFVFMDSPSKIGALKSDTPHPKLGEMITKYGKSPNGSKVVSLILKRGKPIKAGSYYDDKLWYMADQTKPNQFLQCTTHIEYDKQVQYVNIGVKYYINDAGILTRERVDQTMYPPGKEPGRGTRYNYLTGKYDIESLSNPKWQEPQEMQLFATLENGAEVQVGYSNFDKKKG
jgi:hypothetical protein